jgi:Tannase and feruloyl esterase
MHTHLQHRKLADLSSIIVTGVVLLAESLVFSSVACAQQTAPVNLHPASLMIVSATSDDVDASVAEQCTTLTQVDFSGIQDAPTQITAARLIETKSDPAYCHVQGYVSPQVGFEIRLPANHWNGKFVETGCAGACGTVMIDWLCPSLVRKGYACITSDMGHEGRIGDGLWAYANLQAEVDWGFRATHVTALTGKAITERFYKRAPGKSYFVGCSTGGRQGMVEAQRFPWDFDGIIAGAPASDQSGSILVRLWAALAMRASDGAPILSPAALQLVHNAVVAACDMNDGVRDGLIGDPRTCNFDLEGLVCKGNSNTRCLSRQQADALKKIYGGPMTSKGEEIYADGALMPGSELAFGEYYQSGQFSSFDVDFLRYMAFIPDPGPNWQPSDLNFDRDYKRFAMMESLYAANNPDLRAFKANGGKLIVYHGWADAGAGGIPPLKTVDYYQSVEKTMGGPEATRDFFRLFMIPGMGHCGGGEGADHIDYVSYLENWVEHGQAPEVMVGAHIDADRLDRFLTTHDSKNPNFSREYELFLNDPGSAKFTRPVYPYPIQTKYKGTGDPNRADSFEPVHP